MTHPCASSSPPSWCNKKRKTRKRRSTNGLSSVTPSQVAAHFKKHKVRIATKKECQVKAGAKKGRLKKGCFYGRGALKGKILKKTR